MTDNADGRSRWTGVSGWPVWKLPARLLWPIVGVELVAVGLVAWLLTRQTVTPTEVVAAGLVCGLGLLHTEVARPVERLRWRLTGDLHVELTSVWVFAVAVLVPTAYAALVAAVVHLYLWLRSARTRAPLYRELYSTAVIVLSCVAAATVIHDVGPLFAPLGSGGALAVALVLAVAVFLVVNTALVAMVIALSSAGATAADLLGRWDENAVEIAALSLGALLGIILPVNPWLVAFLVTPLLLVQRAALVGRLEEVASLDAKTGLLNAGAWHHRAVEQLQQPRAHQVQAVLVLDLDHFKSVNDRYGHLAGDHVLAAVAGAVRDELRETDLVGRFGGEEFVVLLTGRAGETPGDLHMVAERLRARVAGLDLQVSTPDGPLTIPKLTISVGGAVRDGTHADLLALLAVADRALYAAKQAGRDQVRMARGDDPTSAATRPGPP